MYRGMRQTETVAWRLTRSGSGESNPTAFSQRAVSFAAALSEVGGGTLLVVRDGDSLSSFLVTADAPGADKAALHLGQSVSGNVERVPAPDLSGTAAVAMAAFVPGQSVARETQAGVDPSEAARRIAVALSPGQWVAVSLRAATRGERRAHLRWLRDRMGVASPVHHSVTSGAVAVSVVVGGDSRGDLSLLLGQVAAAMPGFDLEVAAVTPGARPSALAVAAAGTAAWAVGTFTDLGPAGLQVAGLLVAAAGVVWASGWVGLRAVARADLARSVLPMPAARVWPARAPRSKVSESGERVQVPGEYPMAPTSFLVGANVVAGLVAPSGSTLSGSVATASRDTPAPLRTRIGPLIGHGGDGALVHLSAADQVFGTAIFGKPGSGKSVLVRALWAFSTMERVRPSGLPGFPGRSNSMIVFENKGAQGAAAYVRWGQALGEVPVLVEVADPQSVAIDLFAVPGGVRERAEFFVNGLQYAFDDGSIRDQSFTTLVQVFTAALAVDDAIVAIVPGLRSGASPVYYAHVLLAGLGDEAAVGLAGAIISEAKRFESVGRCPADLTAAREALAPLYEGNTPSGRRSIVQAPQNKVAQLLAARSWWEPGRRKVSWAQVLTEHQSVVVNTGSPTTSVDGSMVVEDKLSGLMSSLMMFALRAAIQRHCDGWLDAGRSVSIFADELALLSGSSPEVVTWMRNQGRSFGVRPVFATQYPDQLDQDVRRALMSFSTLVAFGQDNARVAEDIAVDASADGSVWSSADVVNLQRFSVIVRASVEMARVTACTAQLDYFEDDMTQFAARQGAAVRPAAPAPEHGAFDNGGW